METLEDWIRNLLVQPIGELNRRYFDSNSAEEEVEALPASDPLFPRSSQVDACYIEALHTKIRDQSCEFAIWSGIIFRLKNPLPVPVAHDLIDRDVITVVLGHTRQLDEVQWRLAFLVDEALWTFVRDMFTEERYAVSDLQALLDAHPRSFGLLDKWWYWNGSGTSREKEVIFHRWAYQHPKLDPEPRHYKPVPDPAAYVVLMEARERAQAAEKLRREREVEAERVRLEREAEAERLELERIANSHLEDAEI